MTKKIIALILSAVLCVSFTVPAFAAEDDGGFDIESILSSDLLQDFISSDGFMDLTTILIDLVATMNPENIQAMGQEKMQQLVASLVESISDYISLLVGNKDLIFTYDPVKVFGNLFDLDTDSLTTQNPDNLPEHPDEMELNMGDVDGDGRVTAADARQILRRAARIITFTMEQDERADVDFDGEITSTDARIVLRVTAGLETLEF